VAIDRFVDTGATTGGDGTTPATSGATRAYASLSEWEANGPWGGDGTGAYTVSCAATDTGSGNVADTAGSCNIDFVAITSGSILIEQAGSNANNSSTFIDAAKYRLIIAGTCIRPVKNTTIRRMQLDCTSASSFVSAINLTSPGRVDGLTVEYCRIRSAARACMGYNQSNPAAVGTTIIRNNVLVQTAGAAAIDLDSSGTNNSACQIDVYHNTIYSQSTDPCVRILDLSGAAVQTVNVKNNICANSSNPLDLVASTGSLTVTTDYNWTDDGTDGTTNEQNLPATPFTSAGTTFAADFSLTEALATGGAVGSITDDITGTTRGSPPDAGAYEFVDAGGTTYSSAYAESVTMAASFATTMTMVASLGASVTLADALAATMAMPNAFTESVTLGSAFASGNIFEDTLTETVSVTDSYASRMVFANTAAEAVTLATAFSAVGTFAASYAEAVTLADAYAAEGGTSNIWTVVSPDGSTWTAVVPGNTVWTTQ
jgi:hypothetical protein